MVNMLGVIGGLGAGIVIGLFVPPGPAVILIVAMLVIAVIPAFKMVQIPAILAVLASVMVLIVKVYVYTQLPTL